MDLRTKNTKQASHVRRSRASDWFCCIVVLLQIFYAFDHSTDIILARPED